MSDISFYHLVREPLERALPRLLERVVAADRRAVVLCGSVARLQALDSALWTHDPASFLAHGTAADGNGADQPIYLTVDEENPAGAGVLVLVDGGEAGFLGSFERCLDMFDGRDERAVAAARGRWRDYKAAGHDVTYWRQSPEGRWQRRDQD